MCDSRWGGVGVSVRGLGWEGGKGGGEVPPLRTAQTRACHKHTHTHTLKHTRRVHMAFKFTLDRAYTRALQDAQALW